MKITTLALISTATVAATIALPAAPAQADRSSKFLSPSGNIWCSVWTGDDGKSGAACEIRDHTYVRPPKPTDCHLGGWGDSFILDQGSPPVLDCHGDTNFVPGLPTLPYGQTRSAGTITCDSEPTGMTCTDSSTGHFIRVSRQSYELG